MTTTITAHLSRGEANALAVRLVDYLTHHDYLARLAEGNCLTIQVDRRTSELSISLPTLGAIPLKVESVQGAQALEDFGEGSKAWPALTRCEGHKHHSAKLFIQAGMRKDIWCKECASDLFVVATELPFLGNAEVPLEAAVDMADALAECLSMFGRDEAVMSDFVEWVNDAGLDRTEDLTGLAAKFMRGPDETMAS